MKVREIFPTLAAAQAWRRRELERIRRHGHRDPTTTTLRTAADELVDRMQRGLERNRSGAPYRASVIAGYRQGLEAHVLPALGARAITSIRTPDVQRLVDGMVLQGYAGSTIRNALNPLRVAFRHAVAEGIVDSDPVRAVRLPAVGPGRDRFVEPDEARALLAALPERDRATWATAAFAGLRRAELQALRWRNIDLDLNVVSIRAAWDPHLRSDGPPKSARGTRDVPLLAELRGHLATTPASSPDARVFATRSGRPFDHRGLQRRADRAWREAGLERVTLHELRHSYASLMVAAGVDMPTLSRLMGHSTIGITIDRYSHLYRDAVAKAGAAADAYLSQTHRAE